MARFYFHGDIRFRADRCPDRPEGDSPQWAIAGYPHTRSGLAILHPDIEVLRVRSNALDRAACDLPSVSRLLERFEVDDLIPTRSREPVHFADAFDRERKRYGDVGPRRFRIQHEESVIVDIGVDRLAAGA